MPHLPTAFTQVSPCNFIAIWTSVTISFSNNLLFTSIANRFPTPIHAFFLFAVFFENQPTSPCTIYLISTSTINWICTLQWGSTLYIYCRENPWIENLFWRESENSIKSRSSSAQPRNSIFSTLEENGSGHKCLANEGFNGICAPNSFKLLKKPPSEHQ